MESMLRRARLSRVGRGMEPAIQAADRRYWRSGRGTQQGRSSWDSLARLCQQAYTTRSRRSIQGQGVFGSGLPPRRTKIAHALGLTFYALGVDVAHALAALGRRRVGSPTGDVGCDRVVARSPVAPG